MTDETTPSQHESAPEALALTLSGNLPCVGCGYELRGLSILGNCPECGTAIRATVLYKVDPQADALQPLRHPRLVALMLPMWVVGGLVAVLGAWVPRADEIARGLTTGRVGLGAWWSPWIVLVATACSGIGAAVGMTRLHKKGYRRECFAAVAGVVCYVPLLVLLHYMYFTVDPRLPSAYTSTVAEPARLAVRLGVALCVTGILLGLRPNARLLVVRCLALRSGRVDRQTMYATIAAVWVAGAGDVIRWVASGLPTGSAGVVDRAGVGLVVIGSLLMTTAMFSMVVDGWRIRRSILMPSPRLRDVLGAPEP